MYIRSMGNLRIDGTSFPLAKSLDGREHIFTACKRADRFVDVSIHACGFDFGHPVMQRLLQRIGNPEGGEIADIVREEIENLRQAVEKAL